MAKEVIEMEIKSDIKNVTKDTQDWGKSLDNVNESLKIQNKVISDLEKDLVKLKAKQDAIPKGAFFAGMGDLNKKIKETSNELKLEKLALKDLTNQQKEATREVKKSTSAKKQDNKESKESIANFQFMGVSLNGIKKGFSQIIPTAKAMFGTIKAGVLSTGIGALVLAVFALTQSFKRSEEGQEKFERIMAAIGAVTRQVLDAFSDLGDTIIETFKDPLPAMEKFGQGLLKFLRDPTGATRDMFVKATLAYKGFNEETKKEIDALVQVANMRQKARKLDRELLVERANSNREINDIRLQAEDREKNSATQRIALLRRAQKIEEDITAKEIKSKKLLVEAQKLENEQNLTDIAGKDKLAKLEAELINLDTKKLRSQRLLQTQITTAVNEETAAKKAAKDAELEDDFNFYSQLSKNIKKHKAEKEKEADDLIKLNKSVEDFRKATIDRTFGAAAAAAGENAALSKGVAAAQTIYQTQQGIMAAMGATSVADKLIPYPIRLANAIATGVMGAAALSKIMSTNPSGAGAGGGGAIPSASPQTPAPQMMSGSFELGGGQAPETMRAFVVTDEMSNSQNQLANIRRKATI